MIKSILDSATRLGACNKVDNVRDWETLYSLFFSPQGREFCERHNFPSLDVFQKIKPHLAANINAHIDAGFVSGYNDASIAIIGDTVGYLSYNDNTKVHKIILMHGGRAVINASNYAVLLIVNIGNSEITINKDNTVKVL